MGAYGVRLRQAKGFALIDMLFVCGIIGILAAIAMPRLLTAKQAAGAASAIGSMRAVHSGQLTFALTCGGGFYAPKLTTLGTPPPGSPVGFVSPNLGQADVVSQSGYTLQVSTTAFAPAPASCNGLAAGEAGQGYKAGADPNEPSNSRFFAINANGIVWEDTASLFAGMPEVGEPGSGHPLR
jgi:type II secretory pathway pseudopilin PulG